LTVDPWVRGKWRGSRGIISLNFAPVATASVERAWEGLHTFPGEIESPIQMINGVFNGRDRMYMICRGNDDKNRVVEFSQDLENDILEDGTESRISCQFITKMLVGQSLFSRANHTSGTLYLTGVKGILDWKVSARNTDCDNWTFWRKSKECVKTDVCCPEDFEEGSNGICDLRDFCPQEMILELGEIPECLKLSRKIQLKITWRGVASIEGFKLKFNPGDPDEDSGDVAGSAKCEQKCIDVRQDCVYNDYEYNIAEDRWEEQEGVG